MTITESQRRTLDLMAESIGWNWADVEQLSHDMTGEPVAGLTHRQAELLLAEMEWAGKERGDVIASPPETHPKYGEPCPHCGVPMRGCFADGVTPEGQRWGGIVGICTCQDPQGTPEDAQLGEAGRKWRCDNRQSFSSVADRLLVGVVAISDFERFGVCKRDEDTSVLRAYYREVTDATA